MSTIDMITHRADERVHSEADLDLILGLTIWHQMPYLTARRLTQLSCIKRRSELWCPYNMKRIAEARREDDIQDWYFPLLFAADDRKSWKGIHHISLEEIHSERPLALPPLTHLPPESTNVDFLSCAGGLLLFRFETKPQREGVLERLWRLFWRAGDERPYADATMESQKWKPLVVSNPLTKEWRELPAAHSRDVGLSSWDYEVGLRVHMVVDDQANSYAVILISRSYLCVYKSTSKSWACKVFPRPGPWGQHGDVAQECVYASAVVDGRVYFGDLEYSDGIQQLGHVRLFEIDEEAGTWKPPIRYALQHFLRQNPHPYDDHGFRLGSNALEIVECMGVLYAVVPTRKLGKRTEADDPSPEEATAMKFFPLQFRILQLSGAGSPTHGVLHIQDTFTGGDSLYRSKLLFHFTNLCWNWFTCIAKGSMIWVTFEDYLLKYDVVSGQSQTHMVESMIGNDVVTVDMCYTPSFHMKP